jgi:hypothetical protein
MSYCDQCAKTEKLLAAEREAHAEIERRAEIRTLQNMLLMVSWPIYKDDIEAEIARLQKEPKC